MVAMTTTITDIADFVRILNEQPEWNETIRGILLGRELLELPQRFAEFVRVTEENNRLVAERLARLEADVADLRQEHAETRRIVERLDHRVENLEGLYSRLDERIEGLDGRVENLEGLVSNLDGRLGNLEGMELERQVHRDIANIASRWLGFNRVRILQSHIVVRSPEFQDAIDAAEERNLITEAQAARLERTDVIVSARRRSDRQDVHVAIEVSRSIADRDITRASERAESLAAVLETPAISVVVGAGVEQLQQELADRLGVTVIVLPRLVVSP